MVVPIDKQFEEAASQWDLNRLYRDLALAKGEELTPVEKAHLRGLLCGCSPKEIAQQLCKSRKGVEVDLSKTVYQYVRNVLHNGEVKNWRNIPVWLEHAGYKVMTTSVQIDSPPGVQVKLLSVSHVGQGETFLEFNIRVVATSSSEIFPLVKVSKIKV